MNLKLTSIGNSTGLILPRELLRQLRIEDELARGFASASSPGRDEYPDLAAVALAEHCSLNSRSRLSSGR